MTTTAMIMTEWYIMYTQYQQYIVVVHVLLKVAFWCEYWNYAAECLVHFL